VIKTFIFIPSYIFSNDFARNQKSIQYIYFEKRSHPSAKTKSPQAAICQFNFPSPL